MTAPSTLLQVAVLDAAGVARADARAIAGGIPSRALMQRAGAGAAAELVRYCGSRLEHGVIVATGSGNNGGDGWVVAHALHASGVRVRVVECVASRTPDAIAERAAAIAAGVPMTSSVDDIIGGERIVVDALLGTGFTATGALRDAVGPAVDRLRALHARGADLVALDVPSGLDASTGESVGDLTATLTVTFGSLRRGQLIARERCGRLVVLDIGLGAHAREEGNAGLATAAWFRSQLPLIAANAHKGTRGRVAVVGGALGMAGAAMLAARGALRSGAGMVKCIVAAESLSSVQQGEPAALAAAWPTDDADLASAIVDWADAVLLGPGLGRTEARRMVERVLTAYPGPVVLDADALNAFAGDLPALGKLVGKRPALITPHPAEFARLAGITTEEALARRFEMPAELARSTGCAVLIKGVPTVVSAPDGTTIVVAEGSPVLATGGSGDVLGGIAVTLLAQTGDAWRAGALSAFAHGRAAALVTARQVRGYTLDDVLDALPKVWAQRSALPHPPVLVELPPVGELAE